MRLYDSAARSCLPHVRGGPPKTLAGAGQGHSEGCLDTMVRAGNASEDTRRGPRSRLVLRGRVLARMCRARTWALDQGCELGLASDAD